MSTIDLFLINTKSFFKTYTTETSFNNYHKLISTFFTSRAPRMKPKKLFAMETIKNLMKRFLDDLQIKTFSILPN